MSIRAIPRLFIQSQNTLSRMFDMLLPLKFRVDGNRDFINSFMPEHILPGITVYDVGGGKSPLIDQETKKRLEIRLIGIDIDSHELGLAPPEAYDKAICADICFYEGSEDADIIICQAVMEHVPDVEAAFRSMFSILKPGGSALLFTPSKNAVFARLNRVLPENIKKALLFGIAPERRQKQGFRAYYDKCSPGDFRKLAKKCGFEVGEERCYFISSYFSFFFPAYLLWRFWILGGVLLFGNRAAETFSVELRKPLLY